MCGIAGYLGSDPSPHTAKELLLRMINAIGHRGPDGQGVFVDDGVGLGHARLAIVGLEDGQQPMADPEGQSWISFNGEIFNYIELRDALKAKGRRFRTTTDTEVILHLYEEMGLDCLSLLNGDFAFALWDSRRRRMVLARDRMGVRPLFYAERHGTLYFASEVKALLQVPGIEAEIDPFALDQIFTMWSATAPRTIFKDVFELMPAHAMIVDDQGVSLRRYWELSFPDAGTPTDPRSEDEVAEELRALLEDATRLRLRADVPVGAYLSGGLDSSLIAAMARQQVGGNLRTFSVTFESAEHDESAYQAEMVRSLGTDHSISACGTRDIAEIFPDVVRHTERPVIFTAPAPLHMLSRRVREEGMKVVLTGEGADEVFAGYDIFKEAQVRRFCGRQPGSRLRPHLFRKLYPYLQSQQAGLRRQTGESLAAFFGAGRHALDDPLFSHRERFRRTAAAKLFYSGELQALLGDYDAAAELAERLPADFRRWHPLHQALYIETTVHLPGYILSSQGDRMAMAHGIEGRFPFLDHRVIEFAARIPPGMKLKGLTEKYILRRAVQDLLPPSIRIRAKQPYRAPDSQSFTGPAVPDYVEELLQPEAVRATGLFNPGPVASLARKCRTVGVSGLRDNTAFVGILSTQLWKRTFSDASAAHSLRAADISNSMIH